MEGDKDIESRLERYRFEELYFVCRDNYVVHPHRPAIEVYANKEQAEKNCKHWQLSYHFLWKDWKSGVPRHHVEAFRLVPSRLFNLFLKSGNADTLTRTKENPATDIHEHLHTEIFRLMYFVCTNGLIVKDEVHQPNAYQELRHCLQNINAPEQTVEGFFLVREDRVDIIAAHAKLLYAKDKYFQPNDLYRPDEGNPDSKHRFRLLYFICTDGEVIAPNTQAVAAFQEKKECEKLIKNRDFYYAYEDQSKPIPQKKAVGFFPVPEKLYYILATHAKLFYIKDRMVC